jgi:hypothetical protein
MKTIIAGSRTVNDFDLLVKVIKASKFEITEIVSGGAYGVDKMGEAYAQQNGIKCTVFPAEWDNLKADKAIVKINQYGKPYNVKAGFDRNQKMAVYADALIAIIQDESSGTNDMIEKAKKNKLQVYIHEI